MNDETIRTAILEGSKFNTYLNREQIENVVYWKISDALKMRGQSNMDADLMRTMVTNIATVLMRDYGSMTDKEFELILEMGISGELGRETWVSGAGILQWMRLYYSKNSTRIAVLEEQNEAGQKKKKLTKAEIEQKNKEAFETKVKASFAYFKECGTIWSKREDSRASKMEQSDDRAFHLPQWAAMVYNEYRKQRRIPAPTEIQLQKANEFANRKIQEHMVQRDLISSSMEDWRDACLLELHFETLTNPNKNN